MKRSKEKRYTLGVSPCVGFCNGTKEGQGMNALRARVW